MQPGAPDVSAAATLRPLGVGDIVDRVFGIYRSRPLLFLAISAIPYLLLVLFIGALSVVFGASLIALITAATGEVTPEAMERIVPIVTSLALYLIAIVIAALAVSLMQSASLIDAAAARYMGKETTVGGALGTGLRRALDLFVMGLLAFLAFCALWISFIVVMLVAREWYAILAGVVGGLIATVYLAASWMVSPAVMVLERAGPVEALRRSWSLSTGSRWRILGLILLLGVMQIVLSSLVSVVLVASFATDQVGQVVLQQAVNLIASIAWAPVYWGTFAVLYYDLRVRREAFDLQAAAEALPRTS